MPEEIVEERSETALDGPWVCIVWDDPVNLMSYVTFVFKQYFGYGQDKAEALMLAVHRDGKAVVSAGGRDEMERDAQEWWSANGAKTLKTDPYPNRAAALEFLRKDIPEAVAVNLDSTGDPSRAWWVTRIMSELDLYRASKIS